MSAGAGEIRSEDSKQEEVSSSSRPRVLQEDPHSIDRDWQELTGGAKDGLTLDSNGNIIVVQTTERMHSNSGS